MACFHPLWCLMRSTLLRSGMVLFSLVFLTYSEMCCILVMCAKSTVSSVLCCSLIYSRYINVLSYHFSVLCIVCLVPSCCLKVPCGSLILLFDVPCGFCCSNVLCGSLMRSAVLAKFWDTGSGGNDRPTAGNDDSRQGRGDC